MPLGRIAVSAALLGASLLPFHYASAAETLDGRLTIIWIDAAPGTKAPAAAEYWLRASDGTRTRLDPAGPEARRLQMLDRRAVRVLGTRTTRNSGSAAFRVDAVARLPAEAGPPGATEPSAAPAPAAAPANPADNLVYGAPITGRRPWINIRCKFADRATEYNDDAFFAAMFGSARPGLDSYWKEQSNGQMWITGTQTTRWYTLPKPYAYYIYDAGSGVATPDSQRLFDDCTAAADADVSFPAFQGINLMFNDSLGCCSFGGAQEAGFDGASKVYGVTWLPPWAFQAHTAIAHEMGHGLGLMHSRAYQQTYRNLWDVMSDLWFNCTGDYVDPLLGCVGQHTIGYHKRQLGWIPDGAVALVPAGATQSYRIDKLERPASGLAQLVRVPINASAQHYYTIETRRRYGYDGRLPGSAVVIHEVDTSVPEAANVVDGDGNGDPYDAGSRWTPGEAFHDATSGITISVDATDGSTGYMVSVTRPPDPIFADGFETGDVSRWGSARLDGGDVLADAAAAMAGAWGLRVEIDDANPAYLADLSPAGEATYRASFLFNPVHTAMATGERFTVFSAQNDARLPLVTLELAPAGVEGKYQLRATARQDDGTVRATYWRPILEDRPTRVLLEWRASTAPGANDGVLRFYLDDGGYLLLGALDNDSLRVDRALLGAVTGVDPGTRGSIYFDDFSSARW